MGNSLSGARKQVQQHLKNGRLEEAQALLIQHPLILTHREDLSPETTLWHAAAKAGSLPALKVLMDFFHSDASPYAHLNSDHKAAKLRQLLDVLNVVHESALLLTCKQGYAECTAFLASHGASPHIPDEAGHTPMHHAAKQGYAKCIEALVEHHHHSHRPHETCRLCDITTKHGLAPLHFAVAHNRADCVAVLLKHGASLTPQTKFFTSELGVLLDGGSTPLHVASKHGNMDIAVMLLRHDTQLSTQGGHVAARLIPDCEGRTAFQVAGKFAREQEPRPQKPSKDGTSSAVGAEGGGPAPASSAVGEL